MASGLQAAYPGFNLACQAVPDMDFDAELIRRYDRQGPRYTSYPTARLFESHFDPARYVDAARRSNDDPIPADISLYLHLPYCHSPCFYCGCTRLISRDPEKLARYQDRLLREVALQGALFDRDRRVWQLHLGGGTPSLLSDEQLAELWRGLETGFHFGEWGSVEASIEVDPRSVMPGRMAALADVGFNRVSFGIQDFDPKVQAAVNRRQDRERSLAVIAAARDAGFGSVSVDLIYGLPRQTPAGFLATLDAVAGVRPSRVAVYGYAHLPELFQAQRHIDAAELPGPELRLELLGLAVERLTAAGYEYIGMDHFALPEDELAQARRAGTLHRGFQGYSTRAGLDLVGIGMSAIGRVGGVYAQNAKTLQEYYGALDQGRLPIRSGLALSDDDLVRAAVIDRLMCYDTLEFEAIEKAYHLDFADYFAPELKRLTPLAADGLVALEPGLIRVLPRGRFLLRNLAMVFDAYLPAQAAGGHYSRAI